MEKNNWLEYRIIDGEKRYFKRAVANLKLILESKHSNKRGAQGLITDQLSLFRLEHSRKVIETGKSEGDPVIPVKIKVTYRVTVNADAVPDGEIVRCWLPFPREVNSRQGDVTLLKTIPDIHFMAPDTVMQRSVYLEQSASKGNPVVFEIQFTYRSMAQYFDLHKTNVLPYDTTSSDFKKYTRLIVNDEIGGQFVPAKKFLRSEPYDFQRGEVEWRGGNLYFNRWDYHMEVEYSAP